MQLPLELMTQMAGAGTPLMAAPAGGASDAEAMAEAGQFGELLSQALGAQAGTPPQSAAAPGVSLLSLLQNNLAAAPQAPADATVPGEASTPPAGQAVAPDWPAQAIPAATLPLTAPAAPQPPTLPDIPAAEIPPAVQAPMAAPQAVAKPESTPAQASEVLPAQPNGAEGKPLPQAATAQAQARPAARPSVPVDASTEAPADPQVLYAEKPASRPEEKAATDAPADGAVPSQPAQPAITAGQPAAITLPVSVMELQVRAQTPLPVPAVPPPGRTPATEGIPAPAAALDQAHPVPGPSAPQAVAPTAQTVAMQPAAFQQTLQGALKPTTPPEKANPIETQAPAAPETGAAAETVASFADADGLPLPPPPVMETSAGGKAPSKAALPLAVSIQSAPADPVAETVQAPAGSLAAEAMAPGESTGSTRHAHTDTAFNPLHDTALPADMPAEVSVAEISPAPEASTVPATPPQALGAPSGVQGPDVSGKASQPAVPVFHPRSEAMGDQVVEGTAYSVKNGHKELTIRLNPDNLGEVRVNLVSRNVGGATELSARLIASNPESHEALQQQLHQLKDSLEAQGVRIERLSVVMATAADTRNETRGGGDFGQQFNQPQQQNNAQTGHQQSDQFGREAQGGFNLGQPGQGAFGQPSHTHRNHYASVPQAAAGGSAEPVQRPEAVLNENGRISVLA